MEQINIADSFDSFKVKKIERIKYIPYNESIAKWGWVKIAKSFYDEIFTNEHISACWSELIKYAHGVSERANAEKGLYISGPTGTGKSSSLAILNEYLKIDNVKYVLRNVELVKMTYVIVSALKIVSDYQKHGILGIEKYINYNNILIDDLGSEEKESNNYGNKLKVIEYVIEQRYLNVGFTHFTSNLPVLSLKDVYGERVFSRVCEMCSEINILGEDFRTKKEII